MPEDITFSVSDFVAVLNQTMEYAYPSVTIVGELANFRISKNKWVYFDLKDDYSSVKFFGTVYQLPGPLEDGLMVQVRGMPRLHNQFGFSVTTQSIRPVGEGSLKKAAALLEAKLTKEGLFDQSRKRPLPFPPKQIGLIASGESAAYHDFMKIINARWSGVDIQHIDVRVQGEIAPAQIIAAIEHFNTFASPVDVLVLTRGGGSPEDLAAFSTEQVTRAVAASRIPTLVAIGHEVDVSLAELAADQRASTPSNAAELLVPDKKDEQYRLSTTTAQLGLLLTAQLTDKQHELRGKQDELTVQMSRLLEYFKMRQRNTAQLLEAMSPHAALKRGYAVVRSGAVVVRSVKQASVGQEIEIVLSDGMLQASIKKVQ
jgi:exodeoxyribonuclease VII large subunit